MIDEIKRHFSLYWDIVHACLDTLIKIINAKFVFFSFVALAIGTVGVWAPVLFELDLNGGGRATLQLVEADAIVIEGAAPIKGVGIAGVGNESKTNNVEGNNGIPSEIKIGIENFSVFMYVLGILGILAAEHFIKERKKDDELQDALLTFCMLVWFVALVLAFWALKEPKIFTWQLKISFFLSVSLWLSFNVNKSDFKFDLKKTKKGLGGAVDSDFDGFSGEGIK